MRLIHIHLRFIQFKDVNAGDRIRLSVDKGGALLIEDSSE